MANHLIVSNKINKFNKTINVSGDKSLSIRWVLFASYSMYIFMVVFLACILVKAF